VYKYLGLLTIALSMPVMAEMVHIGKTYVVRDAAHGGTGEEAKQAEIIHQIDKVAAASGDRLSMANVAISCFKQGDYDCAYQNMALSLTSTYWWGNGEVPTQLMDIRDQSIDKLSPERAKEISDGIKAYAAAQVEGEEIPKDDTVNLSQKELEILARQGKLLAAGNLAKLCLEQKDYPCVYKWSTLASRGGAWWVRGEEMLALRDIARHEMSTLQIVRAQKETQDILTHILRRQRRW